MPHTVVAQLNAKLRPLDRGENFEDPLNDLLEEHNLGCVTGGGTLQDEHGEVVHSDIEIELNEPTEDVIAAIIGALESLGAPEGSLLHTKMDDRVIPFGKLQELAVYLNGTDLPKEVYEANDVNELIDEIESALGDHGRLLSFWEGPKETALYLYGPASTIMNNAIAPLIESHPLCQSSRLKFSKPV